MKIKARILAVVLAAVLLFALAGCTTDITYITEHEGIKVYTGLYTCALLRGMNTALQYVPSDTQDIWAEQIDGVPIEQWISDHAHDTVQEYVALQLKARELGIELTEDELSTAAGMASILDQYYTYYSLNNVADVELQQFCQMQLLYQDVFLALYGEGGEREIPAQEVEDYYTENYLDFRILTFQSYDQDGHAYTGPELTDYKELIKEYEAAAQEDPSRMDELICRYQHYRTLYIAGDDTANPLPTSGDQVDVTDQLQQISYYDQYDYPAEVLDMIRELPAGIPTLLQYEGVDFLACREDLAPFSDRKNELDLTIRLYLKDEEFSGELVEEGKALDLQFNGAAVRKYAPKTLTLA